MFNPFRNAGANNDPARLDQLWDTMSAEKGDLEQRTEEYARWTIPYICPEDGSQGQEQRKADVAIGPRLVNHLANRIVDTMFPHDRPFFTVTLTPEVRQELREEMGDDAEEAFAMQVRSEIARMEQVALRKMKLTAYRPIAVEAVKHQIIAGNSIIRRMPDGKRVVYGIKKHCIRRSVDGAPQHILLADAKRVGGLEDRVRGELRQSRPQLKDNDAVTLYTEFKLDNGRWHMKQAVDDILLSFTKSFKPVDCPVLPLVWNLSSGDNYGRGLVEDHTTTFHQIDVLTRAMLDMVGIMADIKFLVDPASTLDPVKLNNSERGSYHQGREGDISTPDAKRTLMIGETREIIASLERELAQAFLLNSSAVRDAERVTAEEIRYIAMELESAFGGLYSRLALEWQQHEAEYAISQIDFQTDLGGTKLKTFDVNITTGLESLSREGLLDNLRRAIADLQGLDSVPEEIRQSINPRKFADFIFTNHTVPFKDFSFSQEEMDSNREQQMQMAGRMEQMKAEGKVQEAAGKAAMENTNG